MPFQFPKNIFQML